MSIKIKTKILKMATRNRAENLSTVKNIWLWQNVQRRKLKEAKQ